MPPSEVGFFAGATAVTGNRNTPPTEAATGILIRTGLSGNIGVGSQGRLTADSTQRVKR